MYIGVCNVHIFAERLSMRHVILQHCRPAFVCMYVCMYVCVYVCMYVYMYACMHACIYIYVTWAPALRANVKVAQLRLESLKVDVDRRWWWMAGYS